MHIMLFVAVQLSYKEIILLIEYDRSKSCWKKWQIQQEG